ncbi:MAG: hypothetical protein Q8L93_07595 [Rhodocyclaceae bacterium]|nr:hypothetical protein [Rhodocyclaceae bacterium]MDP1957107.1 hypothetical protein [Rhodocyclaceae bacterium]
MLIRSFNKRRLVLPCLAVALLGFAMSFVDAALLRKQHAVRIEANRALAERLGLTDLALFTEARYTRHPSQADRHAAFQDHPLALEHFPTGSLIIPPSHSHAYLDRTAARAD